MPVVGKNQEPTQEWARNPRFPRRSFDLAWKKQESRPPTARLHRQSLLISSEPPLETVPRRTYGVRECTQHVSTTLGRVWHEGMSYRSKWVGLGDNKIIQQELKCCTQPAGRMKMSGISANLDCHLLLRMRSAENAPAQIHRENRDSRSSIAPPAAGQIRV